ncbi:SAM-dependent methyltransferase [Fructobacillus sp. M2-14]|uniref:SAM-dependent methyltransferase n=1 Tax=Fructobacillus broussonetiae TaxID=2713173 RepID=A0ABS5R1A1_9LACO|nr:class I SAM-dependent methyltransferase [Fructobacillus broussonetiae]MBS9339228.1 SAM-dependent methyltransferase [Fructobacillus broussonetiae]
MAYTNRHFIKNFLEQHVSTGQIVIDGFAKEGQNTRFLASRVGKDGQVLSFHDTKEEANKTAASLFMVGLQDRATILNGGLSDASLKQELGHLTKVDLIVFDYMDDTVDEDTIEEAVSAAWPYLRAGGTLLLTVGAASKAAGSAVGEALDGVGSEATFTAVDGQSVLLEKEASED